MKKALKYIGIGLLVLIVIVAISPSTSTDTSKEHQTEQTEEDGSFLKEFHSSNFELPVFGNSYTVMYEDKDQRLVVVFDPFLPRNDGTLTIAMLDVINNTFGKHTVTDLEPKLVQLDGVNAIMFTGQEHDYYFLPIKEDTGEVSSLVFWVQE